MTSRELSASAPTIELATTNRQWVSRLYSPKSAHSLDYSTAVISSSFAKLTACQIPLWLTQTFSCYFLCYIHRCVIAAFFYLHTFNYRTVILNSFQDLVCYSVYKGFALFLLVILGKIPK